MTDLYISYCMRCTCDAVRESINLFIQNRQSLPDVTFRLAGSDCHLECEGGPVQFKANGKTRLYLEKSDDPTQLFDPLEPESEVRRMIQETLDSCGVHD